MMKKHLLLACSVVTALLMGACADDDLVKSQGGNSVTFDVTIPELATTRAVGDGLTATTLYWGVYDHNNVLLPDISKTTADNSGGQTFSGSTKVTLTLAKDKKYSIIFWAANKDNSMCTVDWTERKMTVNPTEANQEDYDAFCSYEEIENVTGYMTRDVKLLRPFAQLNIGTADIAKAKASGLTVQNTKVVIEGLPTTYNFVDGTTDEATATFAYAYSDPAPVYFDVAGQVAVSVDGDSDVDAFPVSGYDYLSMNYALMSGEKSELVTVTFTYKDDDSQEHIRTYSSVPVLRNYRTNIYGNILTSEADFTVTIDPIFNEPANNIEVWDGKTLTAPEIVTGEDGESYIAIATGSQLAWLAAYVNGTLSDDAVQKAKTRSGDDKFANVNTFKLTANIDLGNELWTPIGFNPNETTNSKENYFTGTFDGNGYVISNLKIDVTDKGGVGLFGAVYNATFKNFTLDGVDIKAVESEENPSHISGSASGNGDYIAGGHMGAIAGYDVKAGEVNFENVHVAGLIKIEGETRVKQGQRVAGIFGGKSLSKVAFNNVTVKGDEGSYIKGYCSTAGVMGQNHVAGTFENVHTDIDITCYSFGAGGIVGIACEGSKFTNCSSAGDLNRIQPLAETSNSLYRIGGIAGCWSAAKANHRLTLEECSYTGTLNTVVAEGVASVTAYDYDGFVGRSYSYAAATIGSTVTINGKKYVDEGNGVYSVDGIYEVSTSAELQNVLDMKLTGDVKIALVANLVGDVMEHQKVDRNVVIDGMGYKYDGTIKIHNGSTSNNGTITIQNVNFETATESLNFVMPNDFGVEGKVTRRYSNNVTVDGCTFTATGAAENTAVGVQAKSSNNLQVLNCKATGMHSLLQAQSCGTDVIVKNATINGKNGVAFKQVKNAVVEGTTITAIEYGIRFDGNTDNYGITLRDNNITAVQPFIVRKMTGKNNTITLEGNNTFTTEEDYQIVITNGSDDEAYSEPTGTYTWTGADNYWIYPNANQVATELYTDIANEELTEITLEEGAESVVAPGVAFNVTSNKTFDFNGVELNAGSTPNSKNYALKLYGDIEVEINDAYFTRAGISAVQGAKLVFNDGTINHNPERTSRYIFCAWDEGTVVTINGGTFTNDRLKNSYFWAGAGAIIYVKGGTFNGAASNKKIYTSNGGQVIITGGTFNFNPTGYVAEGHTVVENSDGTWTVQ